MSKSWMAMSRIRPPEALRYEAGGGAGSRLVMTASSSVPISPPASRSRSARKDGSKRRLKPTITRGAWRRSRSSTPAPAAGPGRPASHRTPPCRPSRLQSSAPRGYRSGSPSTPRRTFAVRQCLLDVTRQPSRRARSPPAARPAARRRTRMTSRARGWRARLRACIRPMRPQPSTAMPSILPFISTSGRGGTR